MVSGQLFGLSLGSGSGMSDGGVSGVGNVKVRHLSHMPRGVWLCSGHQSSLRVIRVRIDKRLTQPNIWMSKIYIGNKHCLINRYPEYGQLVALVLGENGKKH